jgi:putative membrane protein
LLRVAEVRVETASGTEPEAILRVLSMADVAKLRSEIFEKRHATVLLPEETTASPIAPQRSETLLQIPTAWLVKAGLASNKGMIMVGVLMGLFFQQDRHVRFDFGQIADNLPQDTPLLTSWALIPLGVVAALLLIRILGVGWYLLRFHGYQLERIGEDFHLSCGLLTKVSATVPRRRIQFISIHRTPLLRLMKMASIRIETAGGAGNQNEDAAATVTRRWFVPIIPEALVAGLIGQLRVGFELDESTVPWQCVSPRAGRRLIKLCIIGAILATIVGLLITRPWGWLLGVVCLPLFVFWSRRHLKILAFARVDDGFAFRSGVWTRKTSVTFLDRIQTLDLKESLFDRRWGMATLSIDTAAAGPADHAIEVGMMEARQAKAEFELLAEQSAKTEMVWN